MKNLIRLLGRIKIYFIALCTICLCLILFSCSDSSVNPDDSGERTLELKPLEKKISQSGNIFGFKVFNAISGIEKNKNIFISPLSLSFALGMTFNGAYGKTRDDMQKTLELNGLTVEQINENYKSLIDLLIEPNKDIELTVANSIWYKNSMSFETSFIQSCMKYFYAKVAGLDFSDPGAAKIINKWVEENTKGKIKDLIDSNIDPATVMFLINAIYFKGTWNTRFEEKNTRDDQFIVDGKSIPCKMMVQEARYSYYENDDFQAIELPYGKSGYYMTILLPWDASKLDNLLYQMNESWIIWKDRFEKDSVTLYLPKFTMEYEIELKDALCSMGMDIAFSSNADFTGMYKPGKICISRVKQKSFIKVNEEGTEAAAATVVEMKLTAVGQQKVKTMNINHPFIFLIREKSSNTILFMGKVMNPKI